MIIKTKSNKKVLVDDFVANIIKGRNVWITGGYPAIWHNGRAIHLHRVVTAAKRGECVDHISGDVMDCRIANLRICTRAQNSWNTKKHKDNTTGYKGVYFDKRRNKYYSQTCANGKVYNHGMFLTASEAYRARMEAATTLHSEFCRG